MENREILFRGITDYSRHIVYGNYKYDFDDGCLVLDDMFQKFHYVNNTKVIPETVGQFTGALDIDKNEIFQHSIVLDKSTQRKFKVVRSMFFAEFVMEDLETGEHVPISFQISPIRFQIIGTIHDNLLEANNE